MVSVECIDVLYMYSIYISSGSLSAVGTLSFTSLRVSLEVNTEATSYDIAYVNINTTLDASMIQTPTVLVGMKAHLSSVAFKRIRNT